MAKNLKRTYEPLRKKHRLPSFEELDANFEISVIEPDTFSLREVRKKVSEWVEEVIAIIERALQPDTNLSDLYESRVFDEAEKKELFSLYKRLMVAARRMSELTLLNDEKLDADFIKKFSAEWKQLKPQALSFIKKLRESWEKETEESEKAPYMG